MIAEKGSAPGPQINQKNLAEYNRLNVSGSYPIYYGVTFQSAGPGYITLAFNSKEEAKEYAYNYEKGTVEKQEDGSFRYNGALAVAQKVKYDSAWNLTDALNYFAEQAVQELCFDMSDDFTLLSLDQQIIDDTTNLRMLELARSVILYADTNQRSLLTGHESLPVLNNRHNLFLTPGLDGEITKSLESFVFIQDKYGCDSNQVTITDADGNSFEVEYGINIEEQLKEHNCTTGIVSITEETVYEDTATYEAVFFNSGDNTAVVTLSLNDGEDQHELVLSQENDGEVIQANQFSIVDISDALDPYTVVFVKKGDQSWFFTADTTPEGEWNDAGDYKVRVVNRLGYSFSFELSLN